ncbi:hypothetical protein QYE77_14715 (plasmid) [Thermanaerothrix sp. 4228-RoL]|uniref:Uncharacterized protein n=1 Tax=Thermanaerothrix solaris TaxID=3058434 RepID=A0ABU3NRR4_9CHLR|nr:hypothetical protein [Thermanaerothrix sp. 4228-RoL]MDT8899514.1 hypothetical protein [Thermanaerothrix sp. 4228-RoL]
MINAPFVLSFMFLLCLFSSLFPQLPPQNATATAVAIQATQVAYTPHPGANNDLAAFAGWFASLIIALTLLAVMVKSWPEILSTLSEKEEKTDNARSSTHR